MREVVVEDNEITFFVLALSGWRDPLPGFPGFSSFTRFILFEPFCGNSTAYKV